MNTSAAQSVNRGIETTSSARGEDKRLRDACKQFEGIFLGMLLKSMRKTVTKVDLFGSSREEEFFREMLDNELCEHAAGAQSLGIADMLYKQLSSSLKPNDTGNELKRGTNR